MTHFLHDTDTMTNHRGRAKNVAFRVRTIALLTAGAFLMSTGQAQEQVDEDTLRTLSELERPPSFESLMKAAPYDWLVLTAGERVIVCEPLSPRPDTLAQLKKELENLRSFNRPNAQQRERIDDLKKLPIRLMNDPEDYRISIEEIQEIVGIEELMLERAALLTNAGDTPKAWDLLRRVDELLPEWDSAKPVFENLLLKEVELSIQQGDNTAALALLDELHSRNPERPEIPERMDDLLRPLLNTAIKQNDYGRARWLIGRMARLFPDHSLVTESRALLTRRADTLMARAIELSGRGEHRAAVEAGRLAESIQPSRGPRRAAWNRILARYQIVRVAVTAPADTDGQFPVTLPAEQRHRELTTVPLFEADSVDELTHYESSLIEEWDPTDLGRQVNLELQTSRPYWQSQPLLSAGQLADALSASLSRQDPLYNPRLASFVDGWSVRSPSRIEVRFSRVPLNMASLFRFPVVGIAPGAPDSNQPDAAVQRVVLSTRFRELTPAPDQERHYVRSVPEPDGLSPAQYHVAEIAERPYDSRHQAVQAFFRREVDVLPELYPWEVDPISRSGDGTVVKYALPHTHLLVFNPRSDAMRSAQLRRALSIGIHRESLLRHVVLRDDAMKHGRLTAAPWPTTSYARNPLVEPTEFNPRLAFALRFAAEEQLRIPERRRLIDAARQSTEAAGDTWDEARWRAANAEQLRAATELIRLPTLRLIHEPDELMDRITDELIATWKRLSIEIELVELTSTGEMSDAWDIMYRRVSMEEPLFDLWPVLLTDNSLDVELLHGYPDWLRQSLTRLDYAGSARDAKNQLYRLQRDLVAQAFLIPLWEVDRFAAFRSEVAGYQERPLSVYDNVERWTVTP